MSSPSAGSMHVDWRASRASARRRSVTRAQAARSVSAPRAPRARPAAGPGDRRRRGAPPVLWSLARRARRAHRPTKAHRRPSFRAAHQSAAVRELKQRRAHRGARALYGALDQVSGRMTPGRPRGAGGRVWFLSASRVVMPRGMLSTSTIFALPTGRVRLAAGARLCIRPCRSERHDLCCPCPHARG